MSYFNQILDGNIPINVIESIQGFQNSNQEYMLTNDIEHYKLNETITDDLGKYIVNNHEIMSSPYSAYITASLENNRQKVGVGLMNILKISTTEALMNSKTNLIKISKMSDKLSKQDSKLISDTVKKVSNDLSQSIVNIINGLSMDTYMKELLIHIIHLTGITGKNEQTIESSRKQIIMIMELHHQFKTHKSIDILTSLKIKLTPGNLKNCNHELSESCVFDDTFLFKFASGLMTTIEHILSSIMNAAKYDRICEFYAFSVELSNQLANFNANDNANDNDNDHDHDNHNDNDNDNPKTNVIEHFSKTRTLNKSTYNYIEQINKNIDQNKVIEGMSKIINKSINNVVNKNSTELLRIIALSNTMNITGATGASFSFNNIDQSVNVDSKIESIFVQNTSLKIQNDISNEIENNIDIATKQYTENIRQTYKSTTDNSEKNSNQSGLYDMFDVIGLAKDTVTAIGKIGSRPKKNIEYTENIENVQKKLIEDFNLDQSFKYNNVNDVSTIFENLLKSESISKCVVQSKILNTVNLSDIKVDGPINIENVKQIAIVTDVMNCIFTQTVLYDISNKLVNNFDNLIKVMIENIDKKLTNDTIIDVKNTTIAVDKTAKGILQGVGGIYKGMGQGVGSAVKGTGQGVGSATKGSGQGIGAIFNSLNGPLGIILIVCILGGFMYFMINDDYNSGGITFVNARSP
jgi:hypothetical protein